MGNLLLIHLGERAGRHFAESGREDDALALADGHVKITGHPEVLGVGHSALEVFDILEAVIPVRVIGPCRLVGKLHEQARITVVEACRHTVVDLGDFGVDGVVGHTQGVGVAESEHRTEAQCGGRVGLDKCIADEDAVLIGDKHLFFGKDYAANAIGCAGHAFTVKLTYVLMSVGIHDTAAVTVQPEIEWRAVLIDGLVERRQHHVPRVSQLGHRHHKQTVLLAGVAVNYRRAVIGPRLIGAEHFLGE